jgi:hypothetical protein
VSHGDRSPVLAEREASSTQPSDEEGVELRRTANGKGDGVLATRPFATGETVMVGFLVGGLTGNDSHATQVGPGRWALHGGLGPKVNHSCDPNCGVRLNDGQAFDFVARQPIGAGQELTFDYAMRNFTIDHFPAVCLCGAARCRGSVTGWKDLPAAQGRLRRARRALPAHDGRRDPAGAPANRRWLTALGPSHVVHYAIGADGSLFDRHAESARYGAM